MALDAQVLIRITPAQRKALALLARRSGRTVSAEIRLAIEERLQRQVAREEAAKAR